MPHTDPISDFITRMNNAINAKHKTVLVPVSKMKMKILELMVKEGFITSFKLSKNKLGRACYEIEIRYRANGNSIITAMKKISKPGLRIYSGHDTIPKVRSGFGVTILSTPKGILTDKMARKEKVGGELLCSIF